MSPIDLPNFASLRTLVFDLDGTLIDSSRGIALALSMAFESIGRGLASERVRAVIGPPVSIMARRLEPALTDAEVEAIERSFRVSYDTEYWRETVPFEGVLETLVELQSRGYTLAVVTNKPRLPTSEILAQLGLGGFFCETVTRDSRVPSYPSKAAMLDDLLTRRAFDPRATLYLGDTAEDGQAAQANHLTFVHAAYGYESLPEAPHSISRFPALLQILNQT